MRRAAFGLIVLLSASPAAAANLYFENGPPAAFAHNFTMSNDFFLRDVNGDGRTDLLHLVNQSLYQALSRGDGSFALAIQTVRVPSRPAGRLAIGHRNPDGSHDMAGCGMAVAPAPVNFLYRVDVESLGTPAFPRTSVPLDNYVLCATPIFGDFNGDGYDDLAVPLAYAVDYDTIIMDRRPSGGFDAPRRTRRLGAEPADPHYLSGDFNGDGRDEWQKSDCDDVGDFDHDGADEILCKGLVRHRLSDGSFTTIATAPLGTPAPAGSFGFADFDVDGHTDVLAGDRIFLNDATNHLGTTVNVGFLTFAGYDMHGPAIGDFNGDGRPDLLQFTHDTLGGHTTYLHLFVSLNRGWAPQIAVSSPVARKQGSPAIAATIATVNDIEDAAAALSVTVASAPAGVTVEHLTNTGGTITATITAGCSAVSGNIVLLVTDSNGAKASATLPFTVVPNQPPQLGTYADISGTDVTVTPDRPPSDDTALASYTAIGPPGFPATITATAQTGQIHIGGTVPPGQYTITVVATDNCGATASTTFLLTNAGAIPALSLPILILLGTTLLIAAWVWVH